MLKSLTVLALLPTALFAETLRVDAPVTAAVLYAQGATLTRSAAFSAQPGQHDLVITGLPASLDPASVRVKVDGATLGAVTVRQDRVLPAALSDSPDLIAAKAEVTRLRSEIQRIRDEIDDILVLEQAANARLTYLATLSGQFETAPSPQTLQSTLDLISTQTLTALQQAADARRDARKHDVTLTDLTEALARAQQTVKALTPTAGDTAMLSVSVSSQTAISGKLTLTHTVQQAGWQPVYDLHLTQGAVDRLEIRRGALVGQYTGEDWGDVALTLSTSRPSAQTRPSVLYPEQRWITDQDAHVRSDAKAGASYATADAAEAPAPVMEEVATVGFADGINMTYVFPSNVSITSQSDFVRLSLDTLSSEPRVFAHANPLRDETAFLMAGFTNDTGETLLPSFEAGFYLNGQFISRGELPLIASGDVLDLSFGPINGLRLTQTLLDRESGDTGVLTSRNEQRETREISVQNLTDQSWNMRILGQVPYSEQEDLEITWQTAPVPDLTDFEDARGVLAWTRRLPAGDTFTITLSHVLKWPKDMILR